MGKATITANLGAGLYEATIEKKTDRITARIAAIDAELATIPTKILAQQMIVALNYGQLNILTENLVDIANEPTISPEDKMKLIEGAMKEISRLTALIQGAELEISKLQANKAALLSEKEILEDAKTTETKQIWCTDYSTRLTGTVGTMEVTTNDGYPIIIPGHPENTAAGYDYARHGILNPLYNAGVANSLTAFCMEPGWRKWKPFYRTGIITAKVANTASVLLDTANAAAYRKSGIIKSYLNVNQTATLIDVPIEYMGTGGALFRIGDHVVVKFANRDWAQPKIIGFVDHPRPPGWYESFKTPLLSLTEHSVAGFSGKLIPSGDGWPVSSTIPTSGAFYSWAALAPDLNPLCRDTWDGLPDVLEPGGTTVNRAFITGDFHKLLVLNRGDSYQNIQGYGYDGSLKNRQAHNICRAVLFPGDATDFIVSGNAVDTSDFALMDSTWNTMEIVVTPTEDWAPVTGTYFMELFLYSSLTTVDSLIVSGNTFDSYIAGSDSHANPFGTLIQLGFTDEVPPGSPYGNGIFQGYTSMYQWEKAYWSNALAPPYTFDGYGYWPPAPAGSRYYRLFRPESIDSGRWTFRIAKPFIDPGHDIKAIHLAGDGTFHSIRFYQAG